MTQILHLFCGVRINVHNFCTLFGNTLLPEIQDRELLAILDVIINGTRQHYIRTLENGTEVSVTEYSLNGSPCFKESEIRTLVLQQKFQDLAPLFSKKYNLSLVVKKEGPLYFYIGEPVFLDKPTPISNIKPHTETVHKINKLSPTVFGGYIETFLLF